MKLLLIEDDIETAQYIIKGLNQVGYSVDYTDNGDDGLYLALHSRYDAIILDRMLPKMDGLDILKMIRSVGNKTPVLILSALDDVDEKVKGLKAGGDDYLTKPYAFSELLARIEVLLRRTEESKSVRALRVSDLKLDLEKYIVTRAGKKIDLKPREFRLLEYLMRNKGKVLTRTMLLENIWDYNFDPQTNIVDVYISRLRSKIDKDFNKKLIKTIKGIGYKIEE